MHKISPRTKQIHKHQRPLKSKSRSKLLTLKPKLSTKPSRSFAGASSFISPPTVELDDLFNDFENQSKEMPAHTPQNIAEILAQSSVKNTIALVTKNCCSLCIPAYEGIKKSYFKYPNTFHYIEIDLENPANIEEYRGRFKYHIPVVLVNGKVWSKGNFEGKYEQLDQEVLKMVHTNSSSTNIVDNVTSNDGI